MLELKRKQLQPQCWYRKPCSAWVERGGPGLRAHRSWILPRLQQQLWSQKGAMQRVCSTSAFTRTWAWLNMGLQKHSFGCKYPFLPKSQVCYLSSPLVLALSESLQLQEGIDRICLKKRRLYLSLLFPERAQCLLQPVYAVITPLLLKCSHPWGGVQPPLNSTQQEANSIVSDRNYLGNVGRQSKAEIWPRALGLGVCLLRKLQSIS